MVAQVGGEVGALQRGREVIEEGLAAVRRAGVERVKGQAEEPVSGGVVGEGRGYLGGELDILRRDGGPADDDLVCISELSACVKKEWEDSRME